ncbi:MAG: DUF4268 domain-containing protein [Cyclobacteriaceae bacterium]|nr:DUF4268 domain-containing protein [Cyclobacteriaceae bacterium]MCH8515970.1 DUF4268 domain-containing protein [Cyclobacteriaceae bacterium]
MYKKEEAKQLRKEFWTKFGQYMKPVLGADGGRTNWINYKTGVKGIQFRMDADQKNAWIAVEISRKDAEISGMIYEQFVQLRRVFESVAGEDWVWQEEYIMPNGQPISRIYQSLEEVNMFRPEDQASIIGFLKPRIIQLDEFWSLVSHEFRIFKNT